MKIKRVSYIFLLCSALILLGLIFKYMFFSAEAEKTSLLHSDSVQESQSVRDSLQMTHSGSHKTSPSISHKHEKQGNTFSEKEPYDVISPEMDDSTAKIENEEKSYHSVNYNKKHILVKFLPEVEEEIKQGKSHQVHGNLKPVSSRGKFWKVEVGEDESVEELLGKYNTQHSNLVQYAQLDYECSMQKKKKSRSSKRKNRKIRKVKRKNKNTHESFEEPLKEDNTELFNIDSHDETTAYQFPDYLTPDRYNMWHLDALNIDEAWEQTMGNESVVIAILDTGVAFENYNVNQEESSTVQSNKYLKASNLENTNLWFNTVELPENMIDDDGNGYVDDVYGYDFVNQDGHPNDNNGHGTHLASIMVSNTNYPYEDTGIAPNCTLMILKVLNYQGKGYSSTVSEAIYYAVDHGADVINLSLAWPPGLDPGQIMREAVNYANGAGVVMVAGAGNNARDAVSFPAAYKKIISVGATQYDNTRAYYSNYGYQLEIMAPGGNIQIDQNLDGYPDGILQQTFNPRYSSLVGEETLADSANFSFEYIHGTSMATAQVTGIVALMFSLDETLNLQKIRKSLHTTAKDLGPAGWDWEYGYGLIDAGAALAETVVRIHDDDEWDDDKEDDDEWDDDDDERRDNDQDGFISAMRGGNDCNDNDPTIYPGAMEIPYDGIDQNCNRTDLIDIDNDGHPAIVMGGMDCNDINPAVYPGAPEIADDGIDQDCDGSDLITVQDGCSCTHPDCLNDPEIDTECDGCSCDEEIGEEYI